MLKKDKVIDNSTDTSKYVKAVEEDMTTPLNTYYKLQVREKYQNEVILYDSVFFLPITNLIYEMTKL